MRRRSTIFLLCAFKPFSGVLHAEWRWARKSRGVGRRSRSALIGGVWAPPRFKAPASTTARKIMIAVRSPGPLDCSWGCAG
ncbi:hypothetical protein B0H10DRAFT_833801 [Mycena sp. CBHHK59/15]|nr:hypothetical protein B0H10DRAFT_833801 [Mycena sp. CBHHK59/15]